MRKQVNELESLNKDLVEQISDLQIKMNNDKEDKEKVCQIKLRNFSR